MRQKAASWFLRGRNAVEAVEKHEWAMWSTYVRVHEYEGPEGPSKTCLMRELVKSA